MSDDSYCEPCVFGSRKIWLAFHRCGDCFDVSRKHDRLRNTYRLRAAVTDPVARRGGGRVRTNSCRYRSLSMRQQLPVTP